MKKTITAIGMGLALVLTGCGDASGEFDSEGIEIEDCDREDALKGERECSPAQIKKAREDAAKKKASTTKKSTTRKKK